MSDIVVQRKVKKYTTANTQQCKAQEQKISNCVQTWAQYPAQWIGCHESLSTTLSWTLWLIRNWTTRV